MRTHNAGQRQTIQTLLCDLWLANPEASNEEVVNAVLEFRGGPDRTTYAEHRVQIDRNKYNRAKFLCQQGVIPAVPAVNPLHRPLQQSEER